MVDVQFVKKLCFNHWVTDVMFHMHDVDSEGNPMMLYTGKSPKHEKLVHIDVYDDTFVDIYVHDRDGHRVGLNSGGGYYEPNDFIT